jgi:hypothetical protein
MLQGIVWTVILLSVVNGFITISKIQHPAHCSSLDRSCLFVSGIDDESPTHDNSRRQVLWGASVISASFALSSPALAAMDFFSPQADSTSLPDGLLEGRVLENILQPPPYGMEGPDVFYPS